MPTSFSSVNSGLFRFLIDCLRKTVVLQTVIRFVGIDA